MVGGTRIHRKIHEASRGRDEKKTGLSKNENEPFIRGSQDKGDRADVIIAAHPSDALPQS